MKIIINENDHGITVFDLIKRKLRISSNILTKLKKSENGILVNGSHKTVRYRLSTGDIVELETDNDSASSENIVPTDIPVDILYEDRDIILVNKPPFMPTHPSHGHYEDTLANALAFYFNKQGLPFVFRVITRLDRNTSGVVLVAKNQLSASRLSESLLRGNFCKNYLALVTGTPCPHSGEIKTYIKRATESIILRTVTDEPEGAQFAHTTYRVLDSGSGCSLLYASPVTGRTHQLRVHFSHIGHPIIGDELYGGDCSVFSRQALHAYSLTFPHPTSGDDMSVFAPLHDDLAEFIKKNFRHGVPSDI